MCRHCQCRYPKYKIEICWRYRFRVSISMLLVNENIITKLKCNFSFCQYQIESRMSLAKRRENLQSQNTSSNKKLKVRNNNARKKTYWPPTNNKPFYLSCQQPLWTAQQMRLSHFISSSRCTYLLYFCIAGNMKFDTPMND